MSEYDKTLFETKLDSASLFKKFVGQTSSEIEPSIINWTKINKEMTEKMSSPSTNADNP